MIINAGGGKQVVSEKTGKPLSKPGLTEQAAIRRLQQVEYFKRHGKK